MNRLAFILLLLGIACLPGALLLGGHNGLSLLGVLFALLALVIQVTRPKEDTR